MVWLLHKLFWLLHRIFPRGETGAALPLWPGSLAVAFFISATAFSYFTFRQIGAAQPGRLRLAGLAALITFACGLMDWTLLASLPRLGLSFGGLSRGLIGITFLRLVAVVIVAIAVAGLNFILRTTGQPIIPSWLTSLGLISLCAANLLIISFEVYGLFFEPFDLRTTQVTLAGPHNPNGERLRILQISDTHVERTSPREHTLIEAVKSLQPDLILLTGDFANLDYLDDPLTWKDTRALLARLSAPYGVFAVTGSVDTPQLVEAVFKDLPIRVLDDEVYSLEIGDQTITLIGISNVNHKRDVEAFARVIKLAPQNTYRILLYHTPDLIELADQAGIDLYLAGHTHGGQVRLPFYGAVITMSAFGKRYESGLYQLNPTTLYVSRGVGMEGMGLPRVRFLCPPEIVLFELGEREK
jgi:hypothetical protein